MNLVLGLDPSLANTGWVVFGPKGIVERGVCKTAPRDRRGNPVLIISRLQGTRDFLAGLISYYGIKIVGAEQAILNVSSSETLTALTYFLQDLCKNKMTDLVYWSPLTIKTYGTDNHRATKKEMIEAAKKDSKCSAKMVEHEADAYFTSKITYRFYEYINGRLPYSKLTEKEKHAIWFEKTITRGPRKGTVDQKGVLTRWGEYYFPFCNNSPFGV